MFHSTLPNAKGSTTEYDFEKLNILINDKSINFLITRLAAQPEQFAEQNNKVQEMTEKTPFEIPVTISTDPRNHFLLIPGTSGNANGFTQWPETLGFAA